MSARRGVGCEKSKSTFNLKRSVMDFSLYSYGKNSGYTQMPHESRLQNKGSLDPLEKTDGPKGLWEIARGLRNHDQLSSRVLGYAITPIAFADEVVKRVAWAVIGNVTGFFIGALIGAYLPFINETMYEFHPALVWTARIALPVTITVGGLLGCVVGGVQGAIHKRFLWEIKPSQ